MRSPDWDWIIEVNESPTSASPSAAPLSSRVWHEASTIVRLARAGDGGRSRRSTPTLFDMRAGGVFPRAAAAVAERAFATSVS